jgi:hypothetical protein
MQAIVFTSRKVEPSAKKPFTHAINCDINVEIFLEKS